MKQQIRIIGGKFRGKKIPFPTTEGLRPTPDRIKETLFNWLMHSLVGAHCLDAFAGSGALGFEAYSRGAAEVVLVEKSRVAYQNLQRTAHEFNHNRTAGLTNNTLETIHGDSEVYLNTTTKSFDIIFLDPPFASMCYQTMLELITSRNLLTPNGLIYIESPCLLVFDSNHWTTLKQKRAGTVYYSLLCKAT